MKYLLAALGLAATAMVVPTATAEQLRARRNAIIFVADGLRRGSVTERDMPTLESLRRTGVDFVNSHALYPTLTTTNAAAIATGHLPGDTGDFGNTLYVGAPVRTARGARATAITPTPFIENNAVLAELDARDAAHELFHESSLLAQARAQGFRTASIGKLGPVAIQDVGALLADAGAGAGDSPAANATIVLDDSTGGGQGIALAPEVMAALAAAGLGSAPPVRRQPGGSLATAGTREPNTPQQRWFVDATTRAVLPLFARGAQPFLLVYWSRDPDGTLHNQGDSLNALVPGINGPTSQAALANADANLRQIIDFIEADPRLRAETDVFVTSDHGFATISKQAVDAAGSATTSWSASFRYLDASGAAEVAPGSLPPGFLALDLAHELALPLYDPDSALDDAAGWTFQRVDPTPARDPRARQRPVAGNGLIGGSGRLHGTGDAAAAGPPDARVIVAANGGTDLIYLAKRDTALARRIVAFLARQDYVGALFVDEESCGRIAGALPLRAIGLVGSARLPRPSIVVAFRSFALDAQDPTMSAVQVADTQLQQGQGMHGGFGRDSTLNTMLAWGPDFRRGFVDPLPVGNADIAPTLARVLGIALPSRGALHGRVLEEALSDTTAAAVTPARRARARAAALRPAPQRRSVSARTAAGHATVIEYQEFDGRRYVDTACFGVVGERSARASRASASMPAQSPASTSLRGATQLPPTHCTFSSAR